MNRIFVGKSLRDRQWGGFTIVELLIVIVVIGILAAITIVAYSGIQQRANNTKMITVVKAYRDALINFKTLNTNAAAAPVQHGYPAGDAYTDGSTCLGAGYKLAGSVVGGTQHCAIGGTENYKSRSELDGLLKEFISTKPEVPSKTYTAGPYTRQGMFYMRTPSAPRIEYYLDGNNQDCGLPGAARVGSSGVDWNWGSGTRCRLDLPLG